MWPKIEAANCSQRRTRGQMMAAPEKHPKAIAVPTKTVTRILVDEQSKSSSIKQTTSTLSISSRDLHS